MDRHSAEPSRVRAERRWRLRREVQVSARRQRAVFREPESRRPFCTRSRVATRL